LEPPFRLDVPNGFLQPRKMLRWWSRVKGLTEGEKLRGDPENDSRTSIRIEVAGLTAFCRYVCDFSLDASLRPELSEMRELDNRLATDDAPVDEEVLRYLPTAFGWTRCPEVLPVPSRIWGHQRNLVPTMLALHLVGLPNVLRGQSSPSPAKLTCMPGGTVTGRRGMEICFSVSQVLSNLQGFLMTPREPECRAWRRTSRSGDS